ncbi:uncharacterized protein J3D65DRAFT_95143 [Phyllosticta citribraziliensis]|uniref:Ino eighty subunit 1 n=1 Tax=Phyllosticta citribraziliensis TaxID=989973 RepID=A0ABR1LA99_9PEZI
MSQPPPSTSAPRTDEPDPRNSLRHVLADPPPPEASDMPTPVKPEAPPSQADEQDTVDESRGKGKAPEDGPMYTSTTTTTRRNANGSVSSVYSGNKIRHLKKDDGVPLWRKDIQYDFLKAVFDDQKRVFHKVSDGTSGHTFADIYLDAMAKSSKCSKILKDKLLTERSAAINMAMVCLLVNVGRMNTTLNFFPEMRAQLRTYHSIPSLQAHQDPNAYKQLQDAPRLKSILKGATEDTQQPSTIEEIKATPVPRTNPVNLIFVLAQYAPKISEIHFFPPRDFFDLVMRSGLSSKSRARAFLWLMWYYLESNFSEHDALNNPFGEGMPGVSGDATNFLPIKTPCFDYLTPEEEALENVDTEEEKAYGEEKRKERAAILASDTAPVVTGPKRGIKKGFTNNPVFSVASDDGSLTPGREHHSPAPGSFRASGRSKPPLKALQADYGSDTDRTRSASPPSIAGYPTRITPHMRINNLLNDEAPSTPAAPTPPAKGPGRGNWGPRNKGTPSTTASGRNAFKSALDASAALAGAGPHGFYLPLNGADPSINRKRPPTAHQMAVEQHRKKQVDYILDRKIRKQHEQATKKREYEGAIARTWKRLKMMPDGYDSEEEYYGAALAAAENGVVLDYPGPTRKPVLEAPKFAGLYPVQSRAEPDDCGEEMGHWARVFRQTGRRLDRWEGNGEPAVKKQRKDPDDFEGSLDNSAGNSFDHQHPSALHRAPHDLVWVGEDAAAGGPTSGTPRGVGRGRGRRKKAPTASTRGGRRQRQNGLQGEGRSNARAAVPPPIQPLMHDTEAAEAEVDSQPGESSAVGVEDVDIEDHEGGADDDVEDEEMEEAGAEADVEGEMDEEAEGDDGGDGSSEDEDMEGA